MNFDAYCFDPSCNSKMILIQPNFRLFFGKRHATASAKNDCKLPLHIRKLRGENNDF